MADPLRRRIPRLDSGQRRNSTLSDSISEARNSIRSSTDGLFLPRVAKGEDPATEESHWHSAPLGLALLPAIAGVFFQNGSVFVTDVTLLILAAVFLNWSVRLPWDWYRSAQAIQRDTRFEAPTDPIEIDLDEADETIETSDSHDSPQLAQSGPQSHHLRASAEAKAVKELQIHELAALAACFVFPLIGAWLLHGIRGTSEVRPVAHLLKLVQARTLHLQRVVASADNEVESEKVQDLTTRLEELEAHVAKAAAARLESSSKVHSQETDAPSLITQAVVETRRAVQPDIEALNRAVRRYEKRTALTNHQADMRFQELEMQVHDAIALAAAAQRSSISRRQSYAFILIDWACACIVVPVQLFLSILNLPGRAASCCLLIVKQMIGGHRPSPLRSRPSKGKTISRRRNHSPQPSRAPSVSPLVQHISSSPNGKRRKPQTLQSI
ncbi:uncharacterized protein N7477_007414 [Penicillium maclennaniae]|uniref:uncharacterized protein n=1 Tax=Penicillium maclennaniae TaxID=1343394 RepID=UPI002542038E|nr:uncharacterized protein N7477_007414 [Penicillium maclennaniae]KAJ5664966.1 hypothetical protein N7477_007414 [Penicillium maclennaniae]